MELLVCSDIHGNTSALYEAVDRHPKAEALIFLGDGLTDLENLEYTNPGLRIYSVRGNCDLGSFAPADGLAAFGGVLFYYTHGHLYGVKSGLDGLWAAARQRGADAALFGHTHRACCETRDGVTLFNPGSLSYVHPTFGVITIGDGKPSFAIEEIGRR